LTLTIHKPFVLMSLAEKVRIVLDAKPVVREGGLEKPEVAGLRSCRFKGEQSLPS